MSFLGYRCMACGATETTTEMRYRCHACGAGSLQVTYDYDAVGAAARVSGAMATPVAHVGDLAAFLPVAAESLPPLRIGGTPLYGPERVRRHLGTPRLFVKDDSLNPSASFKDRASAVALAHAIELGVDKVIGASTGNAGASMACCAASVGMASTIFVPATAPKAKIAQLMMYGATVITVRGSYDDAYDLSIAVTDQVGTYNRNTGFNPFTREGKKTVSFEIVAALGGEVPDVVIVPTGDGNIISGVHKGFTDLVAAGFTTRLPRLVAAQSSRSDSVTRSWEAFRAGSGEGPVEIVPVEATTIADSISVDVPRDGIGAVQALLESEGAGVVVTDEAIAEAMVELAGRSGIFVEPAAAAAYAGLLQGLADGVVDKDETIVVLATGSGLKDVARAMAAVGRSPEETDPGVIPPALLR